MSLGPEGAGVRITGIVERVFTPPSRKCSFLTVSYPGEKKRQKTELVAFKEQTEIVAKLGVGETVTVTAGLGNKVLTDRAKKNVQVDGKDAWVLQLVVRTVKTDKTSAAEPPKLPEPGAPLPGDPVESW